MSTDAGVVLAAGEGARFGGPKAPFPWRGERLVDRAVRILRASGCDPVVVVLGAWQGDVADAEVIDNPQWRTGMGSSLRAALAHLADRPDVARAVVTLVDLPGLTPAAVVRVRDVGGDSDEHDLAQATYGGAPGHPVVLGRAHWSGAMAAAVADRGARTYLAGHEARLVEVGDLADGADLDLAP